MELVTVKIRGTVVSARYGTLASGDLLRTDADYARHLVDDCGAAEYVTVKEYDKVKHEPIEAAPPAKARKGKG